jgi:hypothetical protein
MEDWLIEVEGEKEDLRELSRLLNSPDLNISEEEGAFILRSSGFGPLPDSKDIHEVSTTLVEILNGAAKLYNEGFQGIAAKAVVRVDENGRRSKYIRLTAQPRSFHLRALPSRHDLVGCWFAIALGDVHAARALILYGSLEHNWRNLYMVLEVIKDDVGGYDRLCQEGWVPKAKVRQFKHTANSFLAIAREARHADVSRQPPKVPMPLEEAKWLVHDLLCKWLESKERGSSQPD